MEPIDHYGYWHTQGSAQASLLHRERVHLQVLDRHLRPGTTLLDAGCGNGRFLTILRQRWPDLKLVGADFSPQPLEAARAAGFEVHTANFEVALPFEDEQFDVVNAAQVIEHIYNPDRFVRELFRVLRPGGYLALSTPNLCAWFNRVLVPLGTQPIFHETSTESSMVGAGFLKRFKRGDHPVGHVRLFTLRALADLLERHGFSIESARGATFDEGLPRSVLPLDRVFATRASLASLLVVLAQREREYQPA